MRQTLGAGVLIIEENKKGDNLILGLDYNGMLADFGGSLQDNIETTAKNELMEESCLLFKINKLDKLSYLDIRRDGKLIYRCYIVKIPKIRLEYYYENRKYLTDPNYLETTGIRRVCLNDYDSTIIRDRTNMVIDQAKENMIPFLKISHINLIHDDEYTTYLIN